MRFHNVTDMSSKTLLAKAIYDNHADAADELSFRKGDIITVLEQDVDGIVGWWLCSLHGNQGIAPGNRMKQISGPAPAKPAPLDIAQPPVEDLDYDVPRARWEGDDYDVPRGVSSPDYDVPKGLESPMDGNFCQDIYDVPLKDAAGVVSPTSILSPVDFEAPSLQDPVTPQLPSSPPISKTEAVETQEVYDVPGNLPMGDVMVSSGAGSNDIYDIPTGPATSPENVTEATGTPALLKQQPVDINHNKKNVDRKSSGERHLSSASSNGGECGIENGKRQSTGSADSGKLSSEDDDYVDYQEIYGFGGDKQVNVYDVPVQPQQINSEGQVVHSGGGKKTAVSILQRINMAAVKGIKLERTAALQRLTKLEQAVDAAVTTLLGFVTSTWRNTQMLKAQIADIRDVAGKAKVALRLLTEFALGTLVNARSLSTQEMSGKLSRSVEPLLETYYSVKLALQRLDNDNWKTPLEKPENIHDDLDSIMVYMQSVPENSRKLVGVIRMGATVLYRSSQGSASVRNAKQQGEPALSKANTPVEDVPRKEVAAKIQKFGATSMKVESTPIPSMSMVAGYIKEAVDANIRPKGNGRKLSPTTVRRLCGMDPPKSPTRRGSATSSDGHTDSQELEDVPVLPARTLSDPVPPPPTRVDSSERYQLIRQKSMDKPSAPPPKPKLNRKNATRKSYKFPRFAEERKKHSEMPATPENTSLNEVEIVRRKCNSDPAKMEVFEQLTDRNMSNSTSSRGRITALSKEAHVHVSDSDLPKSLVKNGSTNGALKSPTTQPLFDLQSGGSDFGSSLTDAQLLEFYKYEIDTQLFLLGEAIKAFFSSADGSHPPKVFVSNSKFIVLSAHKFVFIGDTLKKRVSQRRLKEQVEVVTNKLSESIKFLVSSTKSAALHYPATNALNEVTAAVKQVSECAKEVHRLVKHTGGESEA